ncbi:MAG: hypothetical protein HYT88_02895 [Candidatus Omnitrophica bacterium]|nr:hypothetical protein [Candidatus Omnitrophota bacterium]
MSLKDQPLHTEGNFTHYEWAGSALQRLFHAPQAISEAWPFFSGSSKPARILEKSQAGSATMEELIRNFPEVLGPMGMDPEHDHQKYFFVKFLDPSDFPPFAYVGFNPDAVEKCGKSNDAFRQYLTRLLWSDRTTLEQLKQLIEPQLRTREVFESFKRTYKQWAIEEAKQDWNGTVSTVFINRFVADNQQTDARQALQALQRLRQELIHLMHRIDFSDGEAILIESPTFHAIAGLSLQLHPRAQGNFHPKDELWIYKQILLPDGTTSWILVEPQRTFDRTESGADFFTPFTWNEEQKSLAFRKAISKDYLEQFVHLLDITAHPRAYYTRRAKPVKMPGEKTSGNAQWFRLVDEPAWPYFSVYELRFSGSGESQIPLGHESFLELHATEGTVEVTLEAANQSPFSFQISPTQPAFLPASLPYERTTYQAKGKAQLQYFFRRGMDHSQKTRIG